MFRLVYRERFCRDCHERNQWPICECGYLRPLTDEFSVIESRARYRWTPAGAVPRLPFTAFERAIIRDAILERDPWRDEALADGVGMHDGDVASEAFAHYADAAGDDDLLHLVIEILTATP